MLYSYKKQYPAPLPDRIRLEDKSTRTSLNALSLEELLNLGFVLVSNKPEISNTQVVEWNGEAWIIRDKTQEELSAEKESIKNSLEEGIQKYLDSTAKNYGYDSMLSAVSYVNSTYPKFAAEAAACIAWRDSVWLYCYQVMQGILDNSRSIPTIEELISELPQLSWPTE